MQPVVTVATTIKVWQDDIELASNPIDSFIQDDINPMMDLLYGFENQDLTIGKSSDLPWHSQYIVELINKGNSSESSKPTPSQHEGNMDDRLEKEMILHPNRIKLQRQSSQP